MKKADRITVISNMVVFVVIVGLKYLYRLEYQRGYLDGTNNAKSKIPTGAVYYKSYPDIDALSKKREMI